MMGGFRYGGLEVGNCNKRCESSQRGDGDCRSVSRKAFPYPVFGRFAYILSALVGLTLFWCDRLRLIGGVGR